MTHKVGMLGFGQKFGGTNKQVTVADSVEGGITHDHYGDTDSTRTAVEACAKVVGVLAQVLDDKGLLTTDELTAIVGYPFTVLDED